MLTDVSYILNKGRWGLLMKTGIVTGEGVLFYVTTTLESRKEVWDSLTKTGIVRSVCSLCRVGVAATLWTKRR